MLCYAVVFVSQHSGSRCWCVYHVRDIYPTCDAIKSPAFNWINNIVYPINYETESRRVRFCLFFPDVVIFVYILYWNSRFGRNDMRMSTRLIIWLVSFFFSRIINLHVNKISWILFEQCSRNLYMNGHETICKHTPSVINGPTTKCVWGHHRYVRMRTRTRTLKHENKTY